MPSTINIPPGSDVLVQATNPADAAQSATAIRTSRSTNQVLHVAAAYANPQGWRSRKRLFSEFQKYMQRLPNVRLYVGELSYGDRQFEVTRSGNQQHLQLRATDELWHKENILNLVIQTFRDDWQYGAYIDGDFHFSRNDIAAESIHQLQTFDWVQMFSQYSNLTHDQKLGSTMPSFAAVYSRRQLPDGPKQYGNKETGATGGAWAFRRDSFSDCGCLLDTCITGSADWHMAFGMTGKPDTHPELPACGDAYAKSIKIWQARASAAVNGNIGFVDSHALHYFHGAIAQRHYGTRWHILRDNKYDPAVDIHRNSQGVYELTPGKTGLRDGIRQYFRSRNEDAIPVA